MLPQSDVPDQVDLPGAGGTERIILRDQICAVNEKLGIERCHAFGRAGGGLDFIDLLDGRGWFRTLDCLRDEVIV